MFYAKILSIDYHFMYIQQFLVIRLCMGQCSRGYSHNVSAPSQKSVTTDSKLLQTIYKLFIMKENRCFLPTDYTSTTTLYVSNYLVKLLPYYCHDCAWDNAAEDTDLLGLYIPVNIAHLMCYRYAIINNQKTFATGIRKWSRTLADFPRPKFQTDTEVQQWREILTEIYTYLCVTDAGIRSTLIKSGPRPFTVECKSPWGWDREYPATATTPTAV